MLGCCFFHPTILFKKIKGILNHLSITLSQLNFKAINMSSQEPFFTYFGANESDKRCTGKATAKQPPKRMVLPVVATDSCSLFIIPDLYDSLTPCHCLQHEAIHATQSGCSGGPAPQGWHIILADTRSLSVSQYCFKGMEEISGDGPLHEESWIGLVSVPLYEEEEEEQGQGYPYCC